jgi:hypothetical protein
MAPVQASTEWWVCEPGELGGNPGLDDRACTQWARIGDIGYWSCPAETSARSADA